MSEPLIILPGDPDGEVIITPAEHGNSRVKEKETWPTTTTTAAEETTSAATASDDAVLVVVTNNKKARTQRFALGTKVRKWFNTDTASVALFAGTVTGYNPQEGHYQIDYADGDSEEVLEAEVAAMVVADRVPSVASVPPWARTHMETDCWFATTGVSADNLTFHRDFLPSSYRVAEFFLFVLERQYVYERRRRGDAAPWSCAPLMRNHFWCNNYRELDRGTAYFRAHVLSRHVEGKVGLTKTRLVRRVLFDSYLYRQINRIETFERTGFPRESGDELKEFVQRLYDISNAKQPVFTAAHQTLGVDKLKERLDIAMRRRDDDGGENLVDEVFQGVLRATDKQAVVTALKRLPGVLNFTAWQILCDLQECHCIHVDHDVDTFCELGPGARKGLAEIFDAPAMSRHEPLELAHRLVDRQEDVYRALGVEFPYWRGRPLTIKEVEHALCEFQKMCALKGPTATRGRGYASQQHLDRNQTCFDCQRALHDAGRSCDTCRTFFCHACYDRSPKDAQDRAWSWICHRCKAFEKRFGCCAKITHDTAPIDDFC